MDELIERNRQWLIKGLASSDFRNALSDPSQIQALLTHLRNQMGLVNQPFKFNETVAYSWDVEHLGANAIAQLTHEGELYYTNDYVPVLGPQAGLSATASTPLSVSSLFTPQRPASPILSPAKPNNNNLISPVRSPFTTVENAIFPSAQLPLVIPTPASPKSPRAVPLSSVAPRALVSTAPAFTVPSGPSSPRLSSALGSGFIVPSGATGKSGNLMGAAFALDQSTKVQPLRTSGSKPGPTAMPLPGYTGAPHTVLQPGQPLPSVQPIRTSPRFGAGPITDVITVDELLSSIRPIRTSPKPGPTAKPLTVARPLPAVGSHTVLQPVPSSVSVRTVAQPLVQTGAPLPLNQTVRRTSRPGPTARPL